MNEAAAEFDQAERSLRSAKILLADGDGNGAMNRLYYALYHAVRGALIHRRIALPKSHSGLIAVFGAQFVKPGEISPTLGKLLNQVEHERLSADYSGDTIDAASLPNLIAQAEMFIAALQALTNPPPNSGSAEG